MSPVAARAPRPAPAHEVAQDRCPGLVRPYRSNDGQLVRLRTGGAPLPLATLAELMALAGEYGDGTLQLTSRAAVQLRGVADPLPGGLEERVVATGIIPAPTHELVRNVVASPLSGLDGAGRADIRPIVAAYDAALRADGDLARLPGRFLVAIDDGRGDVLAEASDLAYQAHGPDRGAVYVGGGESGWRVEAARAAETMVALARAFVAAREALDPSPWRVRELPAPLAAPWPGLDSAPAPVRGPRVRLGAHGDAAVVGVPLGLLTAAAHAAIAAVADAGGASNVLVTPWRSLVLPGAAAHLPRLAAAGLVVDKADPWSRVAACTGAPGCARADLDTQSFARALVARVGGDGPPVYVSACERRCGAPAGEYVDLLRPATVEDALAFCGVAR